jgi:hypothetical protein
MSVFHPSKLSSSLFRVIQQLYLCKVMLLFVKISKLSDKQ